MVLKACAGAGSVTIFGTTTGATDENTVEKNFTLDTDEHPKIETARVEVFAESERYTIKTHFHTVTSLNEVNLHSSGRRERYSINLDTTEEARSVEAHSDGRYELEKLSANDFDIERNEVKVNRLQPLSSRLTAAAHTNSRECGSLASTELRFSPIENHISSSTLWTNSADGNTCDGEQFDDSILGQIPGISGSDVPSVFNTTWNLEESNLDRLDAVADTEFSNTDFPIGLGTYEAEHHIDVFIDGGNVKSNINISHSYTQGNCFGTQCASDFLTGQAAARLLLNSEAEPP
ncbi:hypothetical protein GCM10025298_30920 [Natronobiforma cellulositropha]